MAISLDSHTNLDLHTFVATLPAHVGTLERPPILDEDLSIRPADPESVRAAVRDLLRAGGFKPSGRNKPASEYLSRALPSINVAVDAGNAISRQAGLPVSVVDLDRLTPPLRVAIAPRGTHYPFNPAGQVFDATGLICLFDAEGVSASPVKDAQRSKTSAATTRLLCVVWGASAHAEHGRRVAAAYRALATQLGWRVDETVRAPPGSAPPSGSRSPESDPRSGS